jgi:beta-galactosidase
VHPARGLWTCIPHLVSNHPIFEGLPVNGMMRNVYENVWPTHTLRNLTCTGDTPFETVVASIGFDWFSDGHKMQYSGPGDAWWGSDLAIATLGKGRCIVSQLRLIQNLGHDPVADKILFNLIQWLDGGS